MAQTPRPPQTTGNPQQTQPVPSSERQPQQGAPVQPHSQQVNIHGQPPKPNMAPPEEAPSGLGDNTRAEMEAGKANLAQYAKRNDAEHEAGRKAVESRQK
jgi:hypothetical protein